MDVCERPRIANDAAAVFHKQRSKLTGVCMERENDKTMPVDPETILFTLDQLGQTVEVMNKVIARLRGYVHQNMAAQKQGELDFGNTNVQVGKIGPNGLH